MFCPLSVFLSAGWPCDLCRADTTMPIGPTSLNQDTTRASHCGLVVLRDSMVCRHLHSLWQHCLPRAVPPCLFHVTWFQRDVVVLHAEVIDQKPQQET